MLVDSADASPELDEKEDFNEDKDDSLLERECDKLELRALTL